MQQQIKTSESLPTQPNKDQHNTHPCTCSTQGKG